MNPQLFGVVMDRLYAAGALEVFYVPVQMKKNRPGTLLTVIAAPERLAQISDIIFRETTTIGLRHSEVDARVSGPRDRHRRDAARRGALQDRAARRPRHERRAGIRGLREAGRREQSLGQGSAGHGRLGVQRQPEPPLVSRFYLTTAIDFVNSRPHLGTAYEKIAADVIARYKRLCGVETRFLMGNDEHSQNVFKKASEEGLDPLAYCDQMEQEFRRTWKRLDVSFDDFIRTTEPRHKAGVTALDPADLRRRRHLRGRLRGLVLCRLRSLQAGKGPRRRQVSPASDDTPQWIREKNFFFRLSKYQQPLLEHFASHPEFLQPDERRNEILRLLEGGLEDISVSRAGQSWGIPLPFDPTSVVYVWFDALINYASAVGLGSDPALFAKWWPADLHIIGKDITRFHTVIWPAMLMSAKLPAAAAGLRPRIHDRSNGQRMSKSLGTAIDPDRGGRPVRSRSAPPVSHEGDRVRRRRRFLVGTLRRALQHRPGEQSRQSREPGGDDGASVSGRAGWRPRPGPRISWCGSPSRWSTTTGARWTRFAIHEGAAAAYRLIDATNEFIAATSPWALAKDPSSGRRICRRCCSTRRKPSACRRSCCRPFMPASTREILRRVGALRRRR